MSPSDPSRISRKRGSAIAALAQARKKAACGMLFWITDDGDADAQQGGEFALGNRLRRVIGPLGMNVRLELTEERVNIQFIEDDHVIHIGKGRDQRRAGAFRKNGTPFALQPSRAGIGIDSDEEDI